MPNHVTNVLTIHDTGGTDIDDIRAVFLNQDNEVDFNLVISSPKCLDDFEPHTGIISTAKAMLNAPLSNNPMLREMEVISRERCLEGIDDLSPQDKKDVQRAIENYKECGCFYWHDWKSTNWGTKWNAYDQWHSEDGLTFNFNTAWSHPFHIISQISEMLPSVTFVIKYADEDLGCNVGRYIARNGHMITPDIAPDYPDMTPDDKKYYRKMAWEINHHGEDPRTWGYDENFEYSDELYDKYG